ncbi:hypothetical protein FPQ18DRAFT_390210 [Pyronema domesticum]|nr:hypothetical protein FPQ18DRAFT_390210 [Pyronema domesticum]
MTPNPTPSDPPTEPSRSASTGGIVNVFRHLGIRSRGSGFSISASSPATPAADRNSVTSRSTSHFDYYPEIAEDGGQELLERLRKNRPLPERIEAADKLRTCIGNLPAHFLTEIWFIGEDLVEAETTEARQAGFRLLTACLGAMTEPTALDRLRYYRIIAQHENLDDFDEQLQAMIALTNHGSHLSSFEREIGGLLSKWLRRLFNEAGKSRTLRKREGGSVDIVSAAEFCLKELFDFVNITLKLNFQTFEEREVELLLSDVLTIARKTTNKKDIECSIAFIEILIIYGYIPPDHLRPCMEILCGAYSTIKDLAEETWNAVHNLCKSHMQHKCIATLLEILRKPSRKGGATNTNTLRGATWFLEKLLLENVEAQAAVPNTPLKFQVSVPVVMSAFRDAAFTKNNLRLDANICGAICRILARPEIVAQISFDEWSIPLEVLVHVSRRTTERADGISLQRLGVRNVPRVRSEYKEVNSAISQSLFQIINQLEEACRRPDFAQVEGVVEFFLEVYGHIPDSAAEFVLNYYATMHMCYPSCEKWLENSQKLVDVFFRTRKRPSNLRVQVLLLIKDVYDTISGVYEESLLHQLVMTAFDDFQTETDPRVLEHLVKILVDVAADSNMEMYEKLLAILVNYMRLDQAIGIPNGNDTPTADNASVHSVRPATNGSNSSHTTLANIVARGLVKMFIRNMNTDALKAVQVYEELAKIAGHQSCEEETRLTVMRLLFRLRADSDNHVYLTDNTESDYLASVLQRSNKPTEDPHAGLISPRDNRDDDRSSQRSDRSNSMTQSMLFRNSSSRGEKEPPVVRVEKPYRRRVPLWNYPETKPLPEDAPKVASPVLLTFYDPSSDMPAREGPTVDPTTRLRVARWIEALIPIVQKGCDWELYSYVLCHIPSQLANKTLFRNCRAQISYLRNYVCDQLHTNRLPDTDLPSEIKRADIAVSLIHLLTVLVSYREHFAKNETEGIVKAFQLGLHSWNRTAKPCIHALALCCYELPGSTSKFLSGILTKLSQIITSPVVSVHILEFLSALAKLPDLYSNFTEPDFRNIFGIAFRYIQHAKETAHQRSTLHSRGREPEAADQSDLPQYVLTLAYNVLTTWFLSLKLSERSKYVSWIVRGLVLHDQSNNQLDEQSEACIDMLQRFTFSRRDLKTPQKITSPEIVRKHWLNGMTILSIDMAPESGVSRLTIRRPAGTSFYSLKPDYPGARGRLLLRHADIETHLEDDEKPDSFDPVIKLLPSHILLHLNGGTVLTDFRPILLPDDDKTSRFIDVFDRIPVVDFHKIGVIYVGAGQTHETEILSNTVGSPDYADFVDGLGDLVKLQGSDLNTGGLDREADFDGEFTYFWHDRTTEIVFHVITMMPTRPEDPQATYKKRHIGNDFVNIVFNNSGLPWRFGTIPSQFNFVSIVITPEAKSSFISSRRRAGTGVTSTISTSASGASPPNLGSIDDILSSASLGALGGVDTLEATAAEEKAKLFYKVQLHTRDGFSDISPAQEPKMVSAASLPSFVRNLALNASVYSHVFNEGGREYITNPRHRLREIKMLRERGRGGVDAGRGAGDTAADKRDRRVSTMTTATTATGLSMGSVRIEAEEEVTEDLLGSLDFSRYT